MRSVQALALLVLGLLLVGWRWPHPPALPHARPVRVLDVPVLEYHRVGVVAGLPQLTVSPPEFRAEMEWLHGAGYHAISEQALAAALEGGRLPPRPVVITFDDGYRDILWNAAPLLHRLRMPAAAFVIADRIGDGDPSFLDWPELRRLEELGFTIGSHTVHHVDLVDVPPAVAYRELVDSRRELSHGLHVPVWSIAYPLGGADRLVADLAFRAGYRLGFTEHPGPAQSGFEPLLLHRDEILATTGVAGLRALVEFGSG